VTFPSAIADLNAPDNMTRVGVVSSVNPLLVNVAGTDVPCGAPASFYPIIGAPVSIMRQDGSWYVMGNNVGPGSLAPQPQAGSENITVAAASSGSVIVTFDIPFTSVPSVATNINSGSGATSGWGSRAINITPTAFQLFISGSSSSFTAAVQWQAQEMTQ
jgi:hypothetical protein